MYRTIDASFWTDPKVRQLTAHGRLLLLYLITNPHTHVSGIYCLARITIEHETGLTKSQLGYGIDTLSQFGFCGFDLARELVWVKKMMRYQGRGEKNTKSAAHHIMEDLHGSPLIAEFLAEYPDVKTIVGDRVSIGYPEKSVGATPDSRSLIPESRILNTDSAAIGYRGQFVNVALTVEEYEKLTKAFGEAGTAARIETLSEYLASKGKKYKNHYATLLAWERKNGHGGSNVRLDKQERNAETARRLLSRLAAENGSSGSSGTAGSDAGGLPRTITAVDGARNSNGRPSHD